MAIPVREAMGRIAECAIPGPVETVQLSAGHRRIVAQDVVSEIDVPGFASSAMDGFAVRAEDTERAANEVVSLALTVGSRAGHPAQEGIAPRQAAPISTGAALPSGTDSVVRLEQAHVAGDVVRIRGPVRKGQDVRDAGEDVTAGRVVVQRGSRLRAGELGMLAAIGCTEIDVFARPRVAIVVTGDEIVPPGVPLEFGQIYESNSAILAALADDSHATVVRVFGPVADSHDETVRAIDSAISQADIVVICGGVSVGEHDHVRSALSDLDVAEVFWRVALRPGHPTWFGTVTRDDRTRLVFGLPGNPASAYVTFRLFVSVAIERMSGCRRATAELSAIYRGPTLRKPEDVSMAVRCCLASDADGVVAQPTTHSQQSNRVSSLVGTDAIALVPPNTAHVADGDRVTVLPMGL